MALGDVYELVDEQVMFGQTVLNVYFYEQNAVVVGQTVTSAQMLAEAFNENVIDIIRHVQTQDVLHRAIRVRSLFNAEDNFVLAISKIGDAVNSTNVTEDAMPAFVNVAVTLPSENGAVRDGRKDITGISDAAATDGVLTHTGYMNLLNAMCTALGNSISPARAAGLSSMFVPVIVKRVRSGSAGAYSYRLPELLAEKFVATIGNAIFDVILSHRITRGIGKGI